MRQYNIYYQGELAMSAYYIEGETVAYRDPYGSRDASDPEYAFPVKLGIQPRDPDEVVMEFCLPEHPGSWRVKRQILAQAILGAPDEVFSGSDIDYTVSDNEQTPSPFFDELIVELHGTDPNDEDNDSDMNLRLYLESFTLRDFVLRSYEAVSRDYEREVVSHQKNHGRA